LEVVNGVKGYLGMRPIMFPDIGPDRVLKCPIIAGIRSLVPLIDGIDKTEHVK
jgi:hypothetical protein